MTLPENDAHTLFEFTCQSCGAVNRMVHAHRPGAVPHLLLTRCEQCGWANDLGDLTGTPLPIAEPPRPFSQP